MNFRMVVVVGMALVLSACASSSSNHSNATSALHNLVVVTPEAPNQRYQLEIAKLNELITRKIELSDENYAELLFRRGSLYDGLGMRTLSRIDMNHAIEYNPRLVDAYYHLAIHYTEVGEFGYAYELYDGVLELEPEHSYAQLSRGINAYYDDRISYALDDLIAHYKRQPDDPYRSLWIYLAEVEQNPEAARLALAQRRVVDGNIDWGWVVADMMLGAIKEHEFLSLASVRELKDDETLAERMCEAYFYLGKLKQLQGNFKSAVVYFRLAMSTNVHLFLEHRYAQLELDRSQQALEAAAAKHP